MINAVVISAWKHYTAEHWASDSESLGNRMHEHWASDSEVFHFYVFSSKRIVCF